MKEILLNPRHQGLVALIDDDDFDRVTQHPWTITPDGYAITKICFGEKGNRKQRTVSLHRLIMGEPKDIQIDHRNGVRLDCQKSNLRRTDRSGNCRNRQKHVRTSSQYKGVHWKKEMGAWVAQITPDKGTRKHLGCFSDERAAALAYDAAARIYHGEFARLNFPED